ncbi:hypothetical protein [Marinifilum fragile]|uniref:hypothetical protein n=1 Tax=Marinifilum fragile TaxID=570161 RepID=UPI002AA95BF8|nr:hypothetical protein [Marinifilum fragile]
MPKLYIFGIGGTGSRVLKSLTMLMASGVKLDTNIEQVIPIIIDPDLSNGDLNRTLDILKLYHDVREEINNPQGFFHTPIETLSQTQNGATFSPEQFQFRIDGTDNKSFGQFIGDGSFNKENDSLKELLFSQKNLDAEMQVGFKGNPNIGSVVLNQLVNSTQFLEFAQSFTPGDKIFVINSIFGGTGAAGFPLLIKNLRSGDPQIPNSAEIRTSVIGGVTVLPYFNVTPDPESEIDSDTFLDKAKSAMGYYDRALLQNNSLNGFYYIGDTPKTSYENSEGSKAQKNNAHFIELAAALSIVDFCNEAPRLTSSNGRADQAYFKEFGLDAEENVSTITFDQLDSSTRERIKLPLAKFMMCHLYLQLGKEKASKSMWMVDKETLTDKRFFESATFLNTVDSFFNYFSEWCSEMEDNNISFAPFNINIEARQGLHFIQGVQPNKKGLLKSNDSFDGVTEANSESFRNFNKSSAVNQLMKMLEESVEKVMQKRELV